MAGIIQKEKYVAVLKKTKTKGYCNLEHNGPALLPNLSCFTLRTKQKSSNSISMHIFLECVCRYILFTFLSIFNTK